MPRISSILEAWQALPLPSPEQGNAAFQVAGTNAWVYKTPQGSFGLLLAGVSPATGMPKLRHLRSSYRPEKLVTKGDGASARIPRCLEVSLDPECDQATLARVLERLASDEPSGAYSSALLVKTIADVVEMVRPAAPEPSFEEVLGAWGELKVLTYLVTRAASTTTQHDLITSWESEGRSRDIIDFRFRGAGLALEVKTGVGRRIHRFHGYGQLEKPAQMRHGLVASLLVAEADRGETCDQLVASLKSSLRGQPADREAAIAALEAVLTTRGPATRDARWGFALAADDVALLPMERIPRPRPEQGVSEVEWTADVSGVQRQGGLAELGALVLTPTGGA